MVANNGPTDENLVFTDDDLKVYKDWNENYSSTISDLPMVRKEKALVARLEAAERALELFHEDKTFCSTHETCLAYQAWKTVAGKPEATEANHTVTDDF